MTDNKPICTETREILREIKCESASVFSEYFEYRMPYDAYKRLCGIKLLVDSAIIKLSDELQAGFNDD